MYVYCVICQRMSNSIVTMCFGGLFWLNSVAMVSFMLFSVVFVEWLPLKP